MRSLCFSIQACDIAIVTTGVVLDGTREAMTFDRFANAATFSHVSPMSTRTDEVTGSMCNDTVSTSSRCPENNSHADAADDNVSSAMVGLSTYVIVMGGHN